MGKERVANGIHFSFLWVIGHKWNFARLARLSLGSLDLSATTGLRLHITTDKLHPDLPLSVWVKEKRLPVVLCKTWAVAWAPLTQAVLHWEDFEEAECGEPDQSHGRGRRPRPKSNE